MRLRIESFVVTFFLHLFTLVVSIGATECPSVVELLSREREQRTIGLAGGPGVGKGSVAQFLREVLGIYHFSPGNIIGAEVAAGTELGLKAKPTYDAGVLVPKDIMQVVLEKYFKQLDPRFGVLLDGGLRKMEQLEQVSALLSLADRKLDIVIYLDGDRAKAIERLPGRRVCRNCELSYHIVLMPPITAGVCDRCAKPLDQRNDDLSPEIIHDRWKTFDRESMPVLAILRKRGIIRQVGADRAFNEVREDVLRILRETRNDRISR